MTDDAPMSQRRRIDTKDVMLLVAFMVQVCAFVWGAATISASVTAQGLVLVELKATLVDVRRELNELDGRVRVLEERTAPGRR